MAGLPMPCGKDSLVFWDGLLWDDESKDAAGDEDMDADRTGPSLMMYLLKNSGLVRMGRNSDS